MQDFTENIISLDLEVASALKAAKIASVESKKSVDQYAKQKIEEAQRSFNEEKQKEIKIIESKSQEEKKRARSRLDQKIKDFDERANVDKVVKYLVNVAKEGVCP